MRLNSRKVYETTKPYLAILGHFNYKRELLLLMLDYKFQDEQVAYSAEEVEEDVWVFYTVPMDSYDVFDFAIEQTLFEEYGFIKDGVLKFYVNNLFDEDYENSRGYPMTDRTIGGAISFRF